MRLLVSHAPSQDDLMPDARFEAWSDWCVDNGLEFLEADMESSAVAAKAPKRLLDDYGSEEDRGNGKERLLEALSQNMWPKMTKKDPSIAEAPSEAAEELNASMPVPDADLLERMASLDGPDAFEKAISSARGMRDHAMTLPDEERREFASKMALHLMQLMEDMGDDEDDEENRDAV